MPPLTDPNERKRYASILADWHVSGVVEWERGAREKLLRCRRLAISAREVSRLMWEFVRDGGKINRTNVWEPEFDSGFRYEFCFPINGIEYYVETLMDDEEGEIRVVSFHEA